MKEHKIIHDKNEIKYYYNNKLISFYSKEWDKNNQESINNFIEQNAKKLMEYYYNV